MTTPSESPAPSPTGRYRSALGLAAATALLVGGYRLHRAGGRSRLLAAGAWAAAGALAWTALGGRARRHGSGRPPVTQALVPSAARDLGTPGRNAEERLDAAVEETFPASDPIAVRIE